MRVFAADAAGSRGDSSDRLFKPWRQRQNLSRAAIKDGREFPAKQPILFLPKIHRKHPIPSTKKRL
jgi:hypothetical protein